MNTDLTERLRKLGIAAGADKVGIADPEILRGIDSDSVPSRLLKHARSVVLALVADPPAIKNTGNGEAYNSMAYAGYRRADGALDAMEELLHKEGYKTNFIVREWHRARDTSGKAISTLQLKSAGVAAGLGHIGMHTLLITPEYGSRVRLSGFVTDAELECGSPLDGNMCDNCGVCEKVCPSGAISKDRKFDMLRCSAYLFAGISVKEMEPAITNGDLESIRENVDRLRKTAAGWMTSIGKGRRLFYTCGNCIRTCAAEKRFNKEK